MISNCMLQNARKCIHREAVKKHKSANKILIVYGFDWNTKSDNPALICEFVTKIAEGVAEQYSVPVEFEGLGGKDGSIYCDICEQIQKADIALFDVSTSNPNVVFELGLAISSGVYVYILRSRHSRQPARLLSDLNGILEYRFTRRAGDLRFAADLEANLRQKMRQIVKRKAEKQAV